MNRYRTVHFIIAFLMILITFGFSSSGTIEAVNSEDLAQPALYLPGELQWNTASLRLPKVLNGAGIATWNGRVYLTGGNSGTFQTGSTDVYVAERDSAGNLLNWTPTTPLPEVRWGHRSVAVNGQLFVIGGYPLSSSSFIVRRATIQADGQLSSQWINDPQEQFPYILYRTAVVTYGNNIYVLGGYNGVSSATNVVLRAQVNRDGTLAVPPEGSTAWQDGRLDGASGTSSAWQNENPLPKAIHAHSAAVVNGYIYVTGGLTGLSTGFLADVYAAKIHEDGSLGSWTAVQSLPHVWYSMETVSYQGHLLVLGGTQNGSTQLDSVYAAFPGRSGDLSTWEALTPLPGPRVAHTALVDGQTLYSFGGSGKTEIFMGRTITANCQGVSRTKQPLLLVPGWGSADTIDLDINGFQSVKESLNSEGEGWVEGCNLFFAGQTSPENGWQHNEKNAEAISNHLAVASQLIRAWNPEWNGHFDIIGHSYGGLNARFYLESDLYKNDRRLKNIKIDNLFTLGSPHGGATPIIESYPGALVILKEHLKWSRRGSVSQLLDLTMAGYNITTKQPAGTCYRLVGGNFFLNPDLWTQAGTIASLYSVNLFWLLPNDIGVSQRSSLNLILYPLQYRNVRTHLTTEMHGYVIERGLEAVPSYFHTPSTSSDVQLSDTFLNYILPIADNPRPDSSGDSNPCDDWEMSIPSNNATAILAQDEGAETEAEPILAAEGNISAGQTIPLPVAVDVAGKWAFYTESAGGPVALNLQRPDGSTITPAVAEADPDIEYIELNDSEGSFVAYIINNAAPGPWQVMLSNLGTTEAAYETFAVTRSMLVLELDTSAEQRVNVPFLLAATLTSAGQSLTGAVVEATIDHPDGSQKVFALLDDGLGVDVVADDGIYSALFHDADLAGDYWTTVHASGSLDGQDFFRTAQGVYRVAPDSVSLGQVEGDSAADPNENGLYESLAVDVSVAATESMMARLSGVLENGAGEFIDLANVTAEVTAGTQTMTLRFSGEAIRQAGFDGPFRVTAVRLVDSDLMIEADALSGAYTTGAYDHSMFGVGYAPDLPWGPSPAGGAEGVAGNAVLGWSGSDANPYDTVVYDIYLDTKNPPLELVASEQLVTSFTPSADLAEGTTYYWQVVARDESGLETDGPVWSFTTESVATVSLGVGWNMVSSYVLPGDPAVASILSTIINDVVLLKNGDGKVYWPTFGIDQIGDWDVRDGYQIYISNPTALDITGTAVDPSATPVPLITGWNMAAYLLGSPLTIDQALHSIGGTLYLAKDGDGLVYWPAYGINQIGHMQPGQGYQLYMNTAGTLTYPANTLMNNEALSGATISEGKPGLLVAPNTLLIAD